MKNTLFTLMLLAISYAVQSQESLITDLMEVESVNAESTVNYEEDEAKWQQTLDKEQANLDKTLGSMGENYRKSVSKEIETFTKVLAEGKEKPAMNAKNSCATRVNTLSNSLKLDKKRTVVEFDNKMTIALRKLPTPLMRKKRDDLKELIDTSNTNIEAEFEAHKQNIASFRAKEHLIEAQG